eukprot:scaffold1008_cov57-Phaeocystis_antarctica.AAC.3
MGTSRPDWSGSCIISIPADGASTARPLSSRTPAPSIAQCPGHAARRVFGIMGNTTTTRGA